MPRLCLSLLGPLEVTRDGAPVTGFESGKVKGLLAYLAVESDRAHSREKLSDLFWAELDQRAGLDNLRYVLSDLRRCIGDAQAQPPFLLINRDVIQLNQAAEVWLDTRMVEQALLQNRQGDPGDIAQLEAACRLFRGPFLDGLKIRDSTEYEDWLRDQREHWDQAQNECLAGLSTAYECAGDLPQALQAARRLVECAPWDESAHLRLMRLLEFNGQRGAALMQFERMKQALADELGIEPSRQAVYLVRAIRDGTLSIPLHMIPLDVQNQHPAPGSEVFPFVGRDEALRWLDRRLQQALEGHGQAVFVTGEAGSGKTSLVKAFTRRSLERHSDLLSASGACSAFTGSIDPYLPLIELLRGLLCDPFAGQHSQPFKRGWSALPAVLSALVEHGAGIANRLVSGEALLARAQALPRISPAVIERITCLAKSGGTGAGVGKGLAQQSELFSQVTAFLKAVSRAHPLILLLDDLQWADGDTLNLLFYLCRRLAGSRILLVGIYRLDDLPASERRAGFSLPSLLNELRKESGDIVLDLSAFNGRAFVDALLDSQPNQLDDRFRAAFFQHTGGVPLFAVEMLREMQETGGLAQDAGGDWVERSPLDWETLPARIEAVIAERVSRLPPDWQQLLAAASVEGEEFTLEALAQVVGQDASTLLPVLSGALQKQYRMVEALGNAHPAAGGLNLSRYRFRHQLFATFFYARLDPVERAHLHSATGSALESIYGAYSGEISVRLARQFELARHFELANRRDKAAACLLQAGDQALRRFAYQQALSLYRRGISLLVFLPESETRNQLELKLQLALGAPVVATRGYINPDLEQAYARAYQLAQKVGSREDLFQVLSLLKGYYNLRGDAPQSRRLAQEMMAIALESGDSRLLLTAHSKLVTNAFYYGDWATFQQEVGQALQYLHSGEQADLVFQHASDPLGVVLEFAALGYWLLGLPDEAQRYLAMSLERAQALNNPVATWFAQYYAAFYCLFSGEFEKAAAHVDTLIQLASHAELSFYLETAQALQAGVRALNGAADDLVRLENGVAFLRSIGDRMNLYAFYWLAAIANLRQGHNQRVLEILVEVEDLSNQTSIIYLGPEFLRLKAVATHKASYN